MSFSVQSFQMLNKVNAYWGSGQVKNIPVLIRTQCFAVKFQVCFETFAWF